MKNTLVARIFQSLSQKELAKARKFLQSPYFNRRTDILLLFETLRYTDLDTCTREMMFEKIYPGKKYNRLAFNYLCNYLSDRLEQFMACEELLNDRFQHRLLRCKAFRKRGLTEHFETNAGELAADHHKESLRNAGWWLLEYQLQNELFSHKILRNRDGDTNILATTRALAQFFILETLRWKTTARSLEALANGRKYPVPLSDEVDKVAGMATTTESPEIVLAYCASHMQASPDDIERFEQLKFLLEHYVHLFPPTEGRDLYMAAINFAIRRHNSGDRHYTRMAFNLYRKALEINLLVENSQMPKYTFINILNLAQLVGENEWAAFFLEQGKTLLPPADRDQTYIYAQAGFYFRQSAYHKVLELLREVEFSEVFIQLDARKMLLRSYYELHEWTSLYSLLDSFKAFLRRQKGLGYHRESYLNLIKFTKKVEKTATKSQAARLKLAQMIKETTSVAERDWLLGKLNLPQGRGSQNSTQGPP